MLIGVGVLGLLMWSARRAGRAAPGPRSAIVPIPFGLSHGLSPRIGWVTYDSIGDRGGRDLATQSDKRRSTEPSTARTGRVGIARTGMRCDIVVCERSSEAISCPVNSAARPDSFATGRGPDTAPRTATPGPRDRFSSEHRNNTVTSSLQCGSPHPRPATPL